MRDRAPVEIVAIGLPVLAEVVAVILFICMIAVFAAIGAGA